MDFLKFTRSRCAELADYVEAVSRSSLIFDGVHPIEHSSHNHVHLWKLEFLADSYDWIDVNYRVQFVNYILERWRQRLKGLEPYQKHGYRIYLYEDLAPTISVVAETSIGFPYLRGKAVFVDEVRDILTLYAQRSWKEQFSDPDWEISDQRLLDTITKNNGSISKTTAQQLGMPVGKIRLLIINMGIGDHVNAIRKRFRRRPADFSNEIVYSEPWHIFERLLPAHYR